VNEPGVKYHFKPHELTMKPLAPWQMGLQCISAQRLVIAGSVFVDSDEEEVCLYGALEFNAPRISGVASARDMLYLPRHTAVQLQASSEAVVMRFGAPADSDTRFAHLPFAMIDSDPALHKTYGKRETNCRREVWHFIGDSFPARRLMVGICRGEMGGWTAWPPHEHASQREEVYVYFDMGRAFGLQCIYEDLDHPLAVALVSEGDLVSIPRGYHPSVACPAGQISLVYCMAAKQPGERDFMDLNIHALYGDRFQ
jgi:5-deoxy-glucuronate isomerase